MYAHAEQTIDDDGFREQVIISSDPAEHVRRIRQVEELAATIVAIINCSGAAIEGSIDVYADQLFPELRRVDRPAHAV